MAERLAGGNLAVALLATLIALLGPVSGAHFNPAVSFIQALRGKLTPRHAVAYVVVQIAGCLGALLAHAMFELPLLQASVQLRTGLPQWLSEAIATAGLILVVVGSGPNEAAWRVSAWAGASTSFANPAITIARSLSNTFAGIAPAHVTGFVVSQLSGAVLGLPLAGFLLSTSPSPRQT
jgi:glycerol uptake facilitator-like aquaporin